MNSPRRVELLASAIQDEDVMVRKAAAALLGTTRSKKALKPLRVALKDPERIVREHAANGIRNITGKKPRFKK